MSQADYDRALKESLEEAIDELATNPPFVNVPDIGGYPIIPSDPKKMVIMQKGAPSPTRLFVPGFTESVTEACRTQAHLDDNMVRMYGESIGPTGPFTPQMEKYFDRVKQNDSPAAALVNHLEAVMGAGLAKATPEQRAEWAAKQEARAKERASGTGTFTNAKGEVHPISAAPDYMDLMRGFGTPQPDHKLDAILSEPVPVEKVVFAIDIAEVYPKEVQELNLSHSILASKHFKQLPKVIPAQNGLPEFTWVRGMRGVSINYQTLVSGLKRKIRILVDTDPTLLIPGDLVKAQQLAQRKGWKNIVIRLEEGNVLDLVNLDQCRAYWWTDQPGVFLRKLVR